VPNDLKNKPSFFIPFSKIEKYTTRMTVLLAEKYKDRNTEFIELHENVEKNVGLYSAGLKLDSPL
jgi:hypothetical protein